MLLIWSCRGDKTVDWFIDRYLSSSNVTWVRFDTDMFPEAYRVRGSMDGIELRDLGGYNLFEPTEISSVWYRRESPCAFSNISMSPKALEYSRLEAQVMLTSIRETLGHARWVNRPEDNRAASDKLSQLRDAQLRGFRVPKTLITNDSLAAIKFTEECGGKIIAKALRRGTISAGKVFYSNLMDVAMLQRHTMSIAVAPLIFQEPIQKEFEIRAIVVDNMCFGVKIFSQEHEITSIDWRRNPLSLRHEIITLPIEVVEHCVAMTRSCRLWFSAFDLIATPEGEYVFLEHNPAGQFAWLEELTGIPIGKKLLEVLSDGLRQ